MTKLEKQLDNLTSGLKVATKAANSLRRGLRGARARKPGGGGDPVLSEVKKLRKQIAGDGQQLRRMGL